MFASCFYVLKILLHERGHIIYYILAAVFALCFYVLFKFWFVREAAQGSPLVTSLKCPFYFFKAITLFFCVLFKFRFVREGTQEGTL